MSQAYALEQSVGGEWNKPLWIGDASTMEQYIPSPQSTRPMGVFQDFEEQFTQYITEQEEQLKKLQRNYVFDTAEGVRGFLRTHRSLSELLLEAVPVLKDCFGTDTITLLQVLRDEGVPGTIYGVVVWKDSLASARAALRKFDECWWVRTSKRASGRIVFDYQLA
jgi:hypothetical protein